MRLNAQDATKKIILRPEFSTLYSNFERIVESSTNVDTVRGELYFISPGKIYIDVTFPLHQIMTIEGNITNIYYPELEKAFQLESKNPVLLPVVTGLMGAIRPDYGLTEFGFEIYKQKMYGDTLVTYWSHPKAEDKIGSFKLVQYNDLLIFALYESQDSFSQTKTSFSDYISVNGTLFPSLMVTDINSLQRNATEKLFLKDLKVNLTIPAHITSFKIPEHVTIEKKEW